jgi:hypothetical protein
MNSIPLWPPQNRTVGGDNAMTNAISQNVLEEILKAYAAWEQQALRQWGAAMAQTTHMMHLFVGISKRFTRALD